MPHVRPLIYAARRLAITVIAAIVWITAGMGSVASAQPVLFKNFGAASIPLGGTTTLTFNLGNPLANTGVTFTDILPAGLIVATPNGLSFSGTCGGGSTVTATPGSNSISLAGGTTSCTFTVNVVGITAGTKNNSVDVTSDQGAGNTATASLVVDQAATTTAVAPSANPSTFNQSVTFTATVSGSGGTPTGTVTFKDGAATLGTGTLSAGGTATFSTAQG
jgi:uncharacterized repeat protein (TIGR01451 family)